MTNQINRKTNDTGLVRRAQAGEWEAFEALTTRYERRVYSLALRMSLRQEDVEEVTRQTFFTALESLSGFQAEANFGKWLLRIAARAVLEVIRRRERLTTPSLTESITPQEGSDAIPHPDDIADRGWPLDQLVLNNEIQNLLEHALDQLNVRHRLVFMLCDMEGISAKETAEALDWSEAIVKARLLHVRLQLSTLLNCVLVTPESHVAKVRVKSFPDSAFNPRLRSRR